MSQTEEDAGMVGDALADLVEAGKITDAEALGYINGDEKSRQRVSEVLSDLDK